MVFVTILFHCLPDLAMAGQTAPNRVKIRQDMRGRGDMGVHYDFFMAHETDVLIKNAFPPSWGDWLGGCSGLGLDKG